MYPFLLKGAPIRFAWYIGHERRKHLVENVFFYVGQLLSTPMAPWLPSGVRQMGGGGYFRGRRG